MAPQKIFHLRRSSITLLIVLAFFGVSLRLDALQTRARAQRNSSATQTQPNAPATFGALDPTFGSGGVVINLNLTGFLGRLFYSDIKVLADGKILTTGGNERTGVLGLTAQALAVYRFNPNGTLDSAFNANQFPFCFQYANCVNGLQYERVTPSKVIVQADGKILVGGTSVATGLLSSTVKLVLLRLNSDGTLDSTFGINGKVTVDALDGNDRILALNVQADGKILGVGVRQGAFAALRFNSNGSLDATFGTNGIVRLTSILNGVAEAVQVQADGKIVIGGHSGANIVVVRLNSNGTLDSGFGTGGIVTINLGAAGTALAKALYLTTDGKIVIGGSITLGGLRVFAVGRLNINGTLDSGFGSNGTVTILDVKKLRGICRMRR